MNLRIGFGLAVLLGFMFVSTDAAQAKRHHYRHHHHRVITDHIPVKVATGCTFDNNGRTACFGAVASHSIAKARHTTSISSADNWVSHERLLPHPAGCPSRAFCGCGVSVKVFGHPIRSLYLAANWFQFPHAAPAPGMVAVRNHHVMYIESMDANGNAVVYDPNSGGHQTRLHTRSLAGYSIRDPNEKRYASR